MGYIHINSCKNRSFGWQNVWSDESDSGTLSWGGTATSWVQDKHRKNILEKLPKLTAAKCDFLLNKERLWKIIETSLQASDQSKSQVYKKKTAFHPEMHQGSELKHRVLSCLPAFLLTHFVMWVRLCLQGHRSYNASHWANSSNQAWALSTHEQQSKKV